MEPPTASAGEPAVPAGTPPSAGARPEVDAARTTFWRSYLTIGLAICAVEAAATYAYLADTPQHPHRPALELGAATFGILALVVQLAAPWVARRPFRLAFSYGWSVGCGVFAAVFAFADGGIDSPLVILLVLPVFYVTLRMSVRLVSLAAAAAVLELALVGWFDQDVTSEQGTLALIVTFVVVSCALAVTYAVYNARQEQAERTAFEEVHRLSRTDQLTACVNHAVFYEQLGWQLDQALKTGRPLSLIVVDVDLFKSYNDTYGHAAGDAALAAVGAALRAGSRASDVVGRVGGDEFAVLMPGSTLEAAAAAGGRLAERFRQGLVPGLTISVGVAELDRSEPSGAKLFRSADAALYEAKARGRHGVSVAGSDGHEPPAVAGADGGAVQPEPELVAEQLRAARRDAREAAAILRMLQSAAPFGFAIVDRDLRFVRVNEAAARMHGMRVEDILGRRGEEVVPALWPQLGPLYRRALEGDETIPLVEVVARGCGAGGADVTFVESFWPVRVGGEVIGVGAVIFDVGGQGPDLARPGPSGPARSHDPQPRPLDPVRRQPERR